MDAFDIGLNDFLPRTLISGQIHTSRNHTLVKVLRVLTDGQADLLEIALAGGTAGVLSGSSEDGEQNCGQNRDNDDDDQQSDEAESS